MAVTASKMQSKEFYKFSVITKYGSFVSNGACTVIDV
jgi:hypothetical protein